MASYSADHFRLMRSFETLVDLCHRHSIEFWIEFGTLLGAIRHQNVIPWDFDVDMAMLSDEYRRLIALFREGGGTIDGLSLVENYYGEPSSCCCVLFGEGDDLGIDVVAYRVNGDVCETLMSRTLQEAYPSHYDQPAKHVFPLRAVSFLGNRVKVPARADLVLADVYTASYLEPPAADFAAFTASVAPAEAARRVAPPFRPIPEVQSPKEGLSCREQPFIVRGVDEGFPSRERVLAAFVSESSVHGYATGSVAGYAAPRDVLDRWERDCLDINVVDCESVDTELVPHALADSAVDRARGKATSYVVTNRNSRTPLHVDPKWGGGWMLLYTGEKIWWILLEEDLVHLASLGHSLEALEALSFTELVHVADGYLWGRIYVGTCESRDFIYFPEGSAHTVRTYQRAFGLGGYV